MRALCQAEESGGKQDRLSQSHLINAVIRLRFQRVSTGFLEEVTSQIRAKRLGVSHVNEQQII